MLSQIAGNLERMASSAFQMCSPATGSVLIVVNHPVADASAPLMGSVVRQPGGGGALLVCPSSDIEYADSVHIELLGKIA